MVTTIDVELLPVDRQVNHREPIAFRWSAQYRINGSQWFEATTVVSTGVPWNILASPLTGLARLQLGSLAARGTTFE